MSGRHENKSKMRARGAQINEYSNGGQRETDAHAASHFHPAAQFHVHSSHLNNLHTRNICIEGEA